MANILIGVTGGIAAYKAASIVSILHTKGNDVKVIMTDAAKQFVQPLTFSALSHNPVYSNENRFANDGHIHHIELAEWADLFVIAPATYNTIMKISLRLADNLLMSTLIPYIGMEKPLVVCPAMNGLMFKLLTTGEHAGVHPPATLWDWLLNKMYVVGPVEGRMACGSIGKGKLAPTRMIVEKIDEVWTKFCKKRMSL